MRVFASFCKKKRLFFFEKKNQKTFILCLGDRPADEALLPAVLKGWSNMGGSALFSTVRTIETYM
jgi:hypothetical protein